MPIIHASLISPVPTLLKSNEEPSLGEAATIGSALALAHKEIQYRQNIVISRQDHTRNGGLASFVRENEAVLSPIRRIPVELLSKIFFYVALNKDLDISYPPYRLGQVCRIWRAAARNTPHLYTILPPFRLTKRTAGAEFMRALDKFIGNGPREDFVSVLFVDPVTKPIHTAFQMLASYPRSHRWKSISLMLDPSCFEYISTSLVHQIPNLSRIHIKVVNLGSTSYAGRCYAFEDAPELREVEIDCLAPLFLKLPWKQLIAYKERSRVSIGVSLVLNNSSPIERFTYTTMEHSPIVTTFVHATLSRLKMLDIRFYHENPMAFLQLLTLPILEDLRILYHGPALMEDIRNLLLRSNCYLSLKRLSFHANALEPGELLHVLRLLPILEELECNSVPAEDLIALRIHDASPIPHLRILVIHEPSFPMEIDNLVNATERFPARWTSNITQSNLESVKLVFTAPKICDKVSLVLDVPSYHDQKVQDKLNNNLTELDRITDVYKKRRQGPTGMLQSLSDRKDGIMLDVLLTDLEKFEIHEACQIELRSINILTNFWLLDSEKIPQESKYHFLERARLLLHIWTAIFRLGLQRDGPRGRWIRHGLHCLLYLRTVVTNIDEYRKDLLYGRYRQVDENEIFWPYQDCAEN